MQQHHPAKHQLEAFMRGELPRSEASALVRHLLTGCPDCLVVTQRLYQRGDLPSDLKILAEEAAQGGALCKQGLRELRGL